MEEDKSSSATDSYETESTTEEDETVTGELKTLQNLVAPVSTTASPTPPLYPILPTEPTKPPSEVSNDKTLYWTALGLTAAAGLLLAYWSLRR
eukprot:TRINITY_DN13668_c0_g1_i1.p1 TRINITY_DN13668_c0_g1~~TRINITY_DN13668_c0_g1_i1.p1  ORF type:complete len:104 (+),score=18.39 TRINITY_DN13668_c0_g1_i1:35-313(+)